MRFVLTGGTGFVGGALARRLRTDGHEVVALVRDVDRADRLRAAGISLVAAELADQSAIAAASRGADGLFHVAGWYQVGSRDRTAAFGTNVDGTANVLTAAVEAGVPKIVYTSTLAVNSDTHGRVVDENYRFTGRHLSLYDESKAAAHDLVRQAAARGVPVVTVMPGVVYGPGDTSQIGALLRQVVLGRARPDVPRGTGYCWAHVDDIADGHVRAMERGRPGEDYMLAGPVRGMGLALTLAALLADRRPPRVVPTAVVKVVAELARAGELIRLPGVAAQAEPLRSATASYLGSPAKAERELGWSARSLESGMRQTVDALLANNTGHSAKEKAS